MRFGKTRPSKRDRILATNAALSFIAGASPRHDAQSNLAQLTQPVPPKRDRVRRPVDGKPVGATEHQEQCAVISWWWRVHQRYNLPHFALFAIPNGGARDVITGARLKAEGVRPGTPDLMLAKPNVRFNGLYVEMKAGDNKPSDAQREFIAYLEGVGYRATVHWSAASAIKEIEEYLK